jgi:hypothetical protein
MHGMDCNNLLQSLLLSLAKEINQIWTVLCHDTTVSALCSSYTYTQRVHPKARTISMPLHISYILDTLATLD